MSTSAHCPNGHTWDAAGPVPQRCPVCGLSVTIASATAAAEPVTMPPAPSAGATITLPPRSATDDPAPVAAPPVCVPGYEVIAELGRGGMGVVYLARQTKLNRMVALKMILAGGHASRADLERFSREAQAIARLQHPNIVQIHEVGEHTGLPYFSLEFCSGGSLERKIAGAPMAPAAAAVLVKTLARAINAAHERGIIHRDLKPANVLLTDDGTPKIGDFGLAKQLDLGDKSASGAVLGTPSYMAPEQAGGHSKTLGPACDVYALGAILYECLTSRPPFKAATALDTMLQVLEQEPVPPRRDDPAIPRDLETICLKCLHKDPKHRYASAAELVDDLGRFLEGDAVRARPLSEWESALRWAKKHPITAALTLAVAWLTVTMLVFVPPMALLQPSSGRELFVSSCTATVAAFLGTMALIVRPRRWVALVAVALLAVVLAEPWLLCVGRAGGLPNRGDGGRKDVQVVAALGWLDIPLGILIGGAVAGLLGGLSRWAARRLQSDILTAFYGGCCGAFALMMLFAPLLFLWAVVDLTRLGPHGPVPPEVPVWFYVLSIIFVTMNGFLLGCVLTARVTRARLRSE